MPSHYDFLLLPINIRHGGRSTSFWNSVIIRTSHNEYYFLAESLWSSYQPSPAFIVASQTISCTDVENTIDTIRTSVSTDNYIRCLNTSLLPYSCISALVCWKLRKWGVENVFSCFMLLQQQDSPVLRSWQNSKAAYQRILRGDHWLGHHQLWPLLWWYENDHFSPPDSLAKLECVVEHFRCIHWKEWSSSSRRQELSRCIIEADFKQM